MYKYKSRKIKVGIRNGEKKEKFIAVGVRSNLIDLDQLANQISIQSTFTKGDILGVLNNLVDEMAKSLKEGDSVSLGSLGHFSLALKSELFDSPEEITPSKVSISKFVFRPGKRVLHSLSDIQFEKAESST